MHGMQAPQAMSLTKLYVHLGSDSRPKSASGKSSRSARRLTILSYDKCTRSERSSTRVGSGVSEALGAFWPAWRDIRPVGLGFFRDLHQVAFQVSHFNLVGSLSVRLNISNIHTRELKTSRASRTFEA